MITRVANLVEFRGMESEGMFLFVGEKGERHHDLFWKYLISHLPDEGDASECVQGFVDEQGRFYDRTQGAKHAIECGQVIKNQDLAGWGHIFNGYMLYSEDLW
jgi:hypothetical protein